MSLEEIEDFCKSLKSCPKCGSSEGFWLAANLEKSYIQCKHCGAILEICEIFSQSEGSKDSNGVSRRLRL